MTTKGSRKPRKAGHSTEERPASRFFNRELSWLDFNERVLALAEDEARHPFERASFLAQRSNNFQVSSYFLDLGDYFRIRNVMLAYNIPAGVLDRFRMKNAKIYVNAQNLVTFTEATGYSPEVGGSPVAFGIDNGTYPLPATYTVGINLNF